MRKPVRIAFAILFFAILGILAWATLRKPEPAYKGKSLRVWLECLQSDPSSKEAGEAVRIIGTNAIPTLLRMVRAHDPPLKLKLIDMAQKLRLLHRNYPLASTWNYQAELGFGVLGDAAKDAVPKLIEFCGQDICEISGVQASKALVAIGPAAQRAIPSFIRRLTDTNAWVRVIAVSTLGHIHAEPDLVVPCLVKSLSDPDINVRLNAAVALKEFGKDAKPAVPALVHLLDSAADALVRGAASQALKAIDPEAAAQAGVK